MNDMVNKILWSLMMVVEDPDTIPQKKEKAGSPAGRGLLLDEEGRDAEERAMILYA